MAGVITSLSLNKEEVYVLKNKAGHRLALFLLMLFSSVLRAQNSPIQSGTDFFTIYTEPHKWINFLTDLTGSGRDTNAFTDIIILGVNESCYEILIPHLNYSYSGIVYKDNIKRIPLPKNPRFSADAVVANLVFIRSSAPVSVIQGSSLGTAIAPTNRPLINQNIPSWHRLVEAESMAIYPVKPIHNCQLFFSNGSDFNWIKAVNGGILCLYSPTNGSIDFVPASEMSFPPLGVSNYHPADTLISISFPNQGLWMNGVTSHFGIGNFKNINESLFNASIPFPIKCIYFNTDALEWEPSSDALYGYSFEETKPLGYGGYEFHSPSLQGNIGNTYSLHAGADSTVFQINGGNPIRLDSLQRFDTCVTGPTIIRSNNPLYGYMGPCSDPTFNNNGYSPFSVTLNADTELMTESLFATFEEPDTNNHYALSVVLPSSAIPGFLLNGQNPPPNVFQAFPTEPTWSFAQFDLKPGVHKVICPGGFHGYHYTWYQDSTTTGQFPSYGYNLAQSIVWPEDSLVAVGGTLRNNLQAWDSLAIRLCIGDSFYFKAPPLRHTTWSWAMGDGQSLWQQSEEKPAPLLAYSWSQAGNYWLRLTDSLGCAKGDSLLIQVEEIPRANFSYQLESNCSGTSVFVTATDQTAENYQWRWEGGTATGSSAYIVMAGNRDSLEVYLSLSAQNCSDSSSQNIALPSGTNAPQELPNVITPNGDFLNEAFVFEGMESFEGCYHLRVFNRWGALVFESEEVQSPFQGIDPSGGSLASGVYFYHLKLGETEYHGELHLFR